MVVGQVAGWVGSDRIHAVLGRPDRMNAVTTNHHPAVEDGCGTSGSLVMCVAITGPLASSQRLATVGTRAALPMATFALAFPAPATLPTPHERRRILVPVLGDRLQPGHDLFR